MIAALYNSRSVTKRAAESLQTRFGTVSRAAQKYNRAREIVEESIPSGHVPTEAEIRSATMKLYCNTNKYKRKNQMVPAPKLKYVEACLFLRNEPKYGGVRGSTTAAAQRSPVVNTEPEVAPSGAEPTAGNTSAAPVGTIPPASPGVAATVFARPVGVKKMKKMQALEERRDAGNKLAKAVESVGSALAKSSAKRGETASSWQLPWLYVCDSLGRLD